MRATGRVVAAWMLSMLQAAFFCAGAHAAPAPAPAPATAADADADAAPVRFRCDGLDLDAGPRRARCAGNVVVRRGPLMLCCQRLTMDADADWNWQRFVCEGDVRGQRSDERMWAARATFVAADDAVTLTGAPRLARAGSCLRGAQVVVELGRQRARVVRPQGTWRSAPPDPEAAAAAAAAGPDDAADDGAPLPGRCPLAAAAP